MLPPTVCASSKDRGEGEVVLGRAHAEGVAAHPIATPQHPQPDPEGIVAPTRV